MTTTLVEPSAPAPRRPESEWRPVAQRSLLRRIARHQAVPVTIATLVLLVVAAVIAPRTFTPASINAIIIPAGILAIAAVGQTLVIQQKGIDLSVGGMMTLSAVTIGVMTSAGLPLAASLLGAGVIGVIGGLFNAVLVTRLHITPLLATLASNSLFIGLVWTISGGAAQGTPPELVALANGSVLGVPIIGWWALAIVLVAAAVMGRTVFGRRFTGAGANPATARASGVIVSRYILFGYVAAALFAALAGMLLAGYAGQVTYNLGVTYQLPVIAAVVVGGAALSGGRGSVAATAVAALLLTLVVQMVLTLGAPTSVQLLVQSIVLGIAATVRLVPWGRLRTGRRRGAS